MRAPSRNLSVAITVAGVLVAAIAAGLQILLSHELEGSLGGPSDTFVFFTNIVSSLQAAGGLVLAIGFVGLVWSVAAERGLA